MDDCHELDADLRGRAARPDDTIAFFTCSHLPPKLREVSRPFAELALKLVRELPANDQRESALHRLLEAKDCAVRARWAQTGLD